MKKLFIILLALYSTAALAAPAVKGQVDALYVNSSGTVLFRVATPPSACNDSTWPFQFSMDDKVAKEWMSMLLAARTAKQDIIIGYFERSSGRCDIAYVYHND